MSGRSAGDPASPAALDAVLRLLPLDGFEPTSLVAMQAVGATGERRFYGNLIMRKGVIPA